MILLSAWYVLPLAFLLDLVLGDPEHLPHPIRRMGKAVVCLEPVFRRLPVGPSISGLCFSITLIFGVWIIAAALILAVRFIHPLAGTGLEIILVYFSISVRSLDKAAMEVHHALAQNRLPEARKKTAQIVGRDVDKLSEEGVVRAAVETTAENLVDGVVSPLFYAALGGGAAAMAYKMINTLDSMIGYKNPTYIHFGKAAARIDDTANFLPARLSVIMISWAGQILAAKGLQAFKTAVWEGNRHLSPNAGYPEAAFAGTLEVKLGGPGSYFNQPVTKPYIGTRFGPARTDHIKKACDLMILSSLLWLAATVVIMIL